MTDRRGLPQRRATFTFDIRDDSGRPDLTVAYSTFEPPGAPPPHAVAEIFVTARKIGSGMEAIARDAAILLSPALQHGCPLETIRHALTRNQDGSPQSLMGRVVDRVTTEAGS
jgi:hypothetical protein